MTREEFLDFLARCVADDGIHLSEEQARGLLADFELGGIEQKSLPLLLPDAIPAGEVLVSAEVLASLAGEMPATGTSPDTLQEAFAAHTERLAVELAKTRDVADWQRQMMEAVRDHTLLQAMLGFGGVPPAGEMQRIGQALQEQMAFLSRFADETSCRILLGALEG